ncbi:phage baseplate protein [Pseudomonas syringae]|uniref:phage baseplate protein n=1 Tax=Pseudomonas syringae TaxID=317 RepID=UPI000FFE599B|nr:hypothetical protein [Pseudomonas syringae]MCK9776378.1 hypothetical protein [Pseudomonas syringae pv. syringae]RXF65446.1 hypothetical protein BKM77_04145 [Pseudomonas syringae]
MDASFSGFVIVTNTSDVLYFDAITRITETYTSAISKHPLSNGSLITDHTTRENPRYSISGVLSDADFNIDRPSTLGAIPEFSFDTGDHVSTDANGLYKPRDKQYKNNTQVVTPVQINSTSSINKLLPEVIAQFTKDSIPTVVVTPQAKAKTARAVKRQLISMWQNAEQFQVVELLGGLTIGTYGPCVFTNVAFEENAETGEGIFPELTFEQVAFARLKSIHVKIKDKGRQNGKSKTKSGKDDVANKPSTYSGKSKLDYEKNAVPPSN